MSNATPTSHALMAGTTTDSGMQLVTFNVHVNPACLTANDAPVPSPPPLFPLATVQLPTPALTNQQSLAVILLLFVPGLPICPLSKMSLTNVKKLAKFRTLTLGNGIRLRLTALQIPDPPAMSFANNIPWLNSMWDDTSALGAESHGYASKATPLPSFTGLHCTSIRDQSSGRD